MMQLVVTNGTAKDLNGVGDVRGKTGEAEFEGGSHSWFAGYRGDMAFAALIVGGGSSEYAVRMLRWMLESCRLILGVRTRAHGEATSAARSARHNAPGRG